MRKILGFFCSYFFQFLLKFSDFVNLMIASVKSYPNLIECIQFFFKKRFEANEKLFFSCENMRNLGNYIYGYAYSFFSEDL